MAILKRIRNKGDCTRRSKYLVKNAVAIRTDIPSPVIFRIPSYISLDSPEIEALKRDIAEEFNKFLLLHQGNFKTEHFVIRFSHHLSKDEIKRVLDRLEELFLDPNRYHLYTVHQREHGTTFHVLESGDYLGRVRRFDRKGFLNFKKSVIKLLKPFMNEKEREAAENFKRGISRVDWKSPIELKYPDRSFKEHIRRVIEEAIKYLEEGKPEKAEEILKKRNIELVEYKKGERSPKGRVLKKPRLYAIYKGTNVAIRLDKKMPATYRKWVEANEKYQNKQDKTETGEKQESFGNWKIKKIDNETWIIDGMKFTREDIRDNFLAFLDCPDKEIKRIAEEGYFEFLDEESKMAAEYIDELEKLYSGDESETEEEHNSKENSEDNNS